MPVSKFTSTLLLPPVGGDDFCFCSATLSEDGKHRISLTRVWNTSKPMCAFVGHNPATAMSELDDMTVRKYMGFCKRWGFGGYIGGNLSDYRATDPVELVILKHHVLITPQNLEWLNSLIQSKGLAIICCWGETHHPDLKRLAAYFLSECYKKRRPVFCIAKTAKGFPAHASRLGYTAKPLPYLEPQRATPPGATKQGVNTDEEYHNARERSQAAGPGRTVRLRWKR